MPNPSNLQKINFDRCDHRILGSCDEGTDGCCAVVACDLCLRLFDAYVTPDEYDTVDPIASGRAAFSGNGYTGQIESITFSAEWVRDYQTGVCKVIVEIVDPFDTQLLEFTKCYDAEADCMFPAGEQEVTYLLEGVPKLVKLVWAPLDIMTLRHRRDPYNECQLPACGECTCSTRDLCLVLTSSEGCSESLLVKGSKPPDPLCILEELPEWNYSFLCGYTSVVGSLRLEHNYSTGKCELIHEIPENYLEQVVVLNGDECRDINETFTWSAGQSGEEITYTLSVRSSDCEECKPENCPKYCCEGRPETLYMHIIPQHIEENSGGGVEPDCLECVCAQSYNIPLKIHDECALISDEEAGWRTGRRFGEADLSENIACMTEPDGTAGVQLMCNGVYSPNDPNKEYHLRSTGGTDLQLGEGVIVPASCEDFPASMYFSSVGSHALGACNTNTVFFDVLITLMPLASPPSHNISCP